MTHHGSARAAVVPTAMMWRGRPAHGEPDGPANAHIAGAFLFCGSAAAPSAQAGSRGRREKKKEKQEETKQGGGNIRFLGARYTAVIQHLDDLVQKLKKRLRVPVVSLQSKMPPNPKVGIPVPDMCP